MTPINKLKRGGEGWMTNVKIQDKQELERREGKVHTINQQ